MTTIAYRDGVMAGDGRETYIEEGESSQVARNDCVKVHRLPDGRLFGAAKTSTCINELHEALVKGSSGWRRLFKKYRWPTPKLDDVYAIVVDLDRTAHYYDGVRWEPSHEDFAAVGSGARYALPAMDAGAGARKAVYIGMKRDPFSGGKVTVLELEAAEDPSDPE